MLVAALTLADLQMAIVNGIEWIIIIAIIAVVIFGAKKIPELARSFGRASTEYEKARLEAKKELQKIKDHGTTPEADPLQNREKLESVAATLGIDYSQMSDDELRSAIRTEINKNRNEA
jgi:sec-independent protein translocase protein TatA